jgi:hypothetical protein
LKIAKTAKFAVVNLGGCNAHINGA